MKSLVNFLLLAFALVIFQFSCTKSNNTPQSIMGKWNIKIDSSYVGVASNNHKIVYIGQSGDYFNFSSDGHVYIKENSILDTLIYALSSDSIWIKNFGSGVGKGQFQTASTRNLIISSGYFYSPAGAFGRTVFLTR
jgi:hypothetical protein